MGSVCSIGVLTILNIAGAIVMVANSVAVAEYLASSAKETSGQQVREEPQPAIVPAASKIKKKDELPPLVLPAPAQIKDENAFILVGPNVRTIIIIGEQPKYVFPYWGGHKILQRYLKLITGIDVKIAQARKLRGIDINRMYDFRIWVGDQPQIRAFIGKDLSRIDDDGFIIRSVGRDLYICGKFDWGTHFAVYDLLERFAGCRWYLWEPRFWMPKEDGYYGPGDVIPKAKSVKIPKDTNIVEEPSYRMRWMRHLPRHSFRMRYRDRFHHALVNYLHPKDYGKEHPEYYPLINGKRRVPPLDRPYLFQPCVSNPEVVDIIVNKIKQYFRDNPGEGSASIGMNDTGIDKCCKCEKCLAIAPGHITGKNERIAYAFLDFHNRIAEEVTKEFPDKRLGCLAYSVLSEVLGGSVEFHPIIVPYLTRDSAQLFDLDQRKEFKEKVNRWSKAAKRMGIYEYCYGKGFVIPRLYNRYITKNIKERYGVGVDGFYGEDYPNWGLDGHKYWLMTKLLWDHKADPGKLLEDYYRNMFGPCASVMKRYFDYLEEFWCTQSLESTKSNYRWYYDVKQLEIFTPEKCDKAWAMLVEAEELIGKYLAREKQDRVLKYCMRVAERINYFKRTFAFTRFMCYRYNYAKELEKIADMQQIRFDEAMKWLDKWADSGSLRENYDQVRALPHAINLDEYRLFLEHWDKSPGPGRGIHKLVDEVVSLALERNSSRAGAIRSEIDRVLEKNEVGDFKYSRGRKLISDIAKESGFFFVRSAESKPVIDGRINEQEWGEPAYSGRFHVAYSIFDRVRDKTTIWAMEDGERLYMAFLCEGNPEVIGANVQGRNTDVSSYPKMRFDDCISMTMKQDRGGFNVISINVNGAIRDKHGKNQLVSDAKVIKTEKGWQAEMAIDLNKSYLSKRLVSKNPTRICISRYYRYKKMDNGKEVISKGGCSTITPVARYGRIIGHGNHVNCMVFIDGPYIVYGNPLQG